MDDDTIREIIESLPEKRSRSRLEPYRQLIAELRRHRRTYREIAHVLGEKCDVQVSAAAVHNFVRLHLQRKGSRRDRVAPRPSPFSALRERRGGATEARADTGNNDEIRRRIQELKRRPVHVEPPQKVFHYNPDEPLHLVPKDQKN